MPSDLPSPFVFWSQDAKHIFLKVDLKDVKDECIMMDEGTLSVVANGVGAHGQSKYSFTLNFYGNLDSNETSHETKITDRAMELRLLKESSSWWPRLIRHQQKPAWLKVDFEKWKCEDDDLSDNNLDGLGSRDVIGDYPELYEKLKKQEFGYVKEDVKKVYLVFYNLTQFIFFTYILLVMAVRYAKEGADSMSSTYEAVGSVLKFAQLIQYMEVMNPIFGYTRGKPIIPFLQVTGRALVLFGMIEAEPRMQTKPVVFYLTLVWSLVEIFRYPYYITEVYKKDIKFLTWIRYTIWIPLYPLGALCEGIIILRNIPYFEETGRFIVAMPNAWNVTFHTPTLMRLYLLLFFFPGVYSLMTHMFKARIRKLSNQRKRKVN